jgi:hypothetical protein
MSQERRSVRRISVNTYNGRLRSPMAEAGDLKSLKCGFESHRRHQWHLADMNRNSLADNYLSRINLYHVYLLRRTRRGDERTNHNKGWSPTRSLGAWLPPRGSLARRQAAPGGTPDTSSGCPGSELQLEPAPRAYGAALAGLELTLYARTSSRVSGTALKLVWARIC